MGKLWQFSIFALLAGCGASGMVGGSPAARTVPYADVASEGRSSPTELMYVLGGAESITHPDIEVLNATDRSPNQKPLYTIAARSGGEYGHLAVDANDNLYATDHFANNTELDVFPSGSRKATVQCLLGFSPQGMYLSRSTLYLGTKSSTVREYALPLPVQRPCPKPIRTLVDQRAQLKAQAFIAVVVDPQSDIFDAWESPGSKAQDHMDEFTAGQTKAHRYAPLGDFAGSVLAADSKGNVIAEIAQEETGLEEEIAIFPRGSHHAKLHYPLHSGLYEGVAFGKGDKQLFVLRDHPNQAVDVFAYDPAGAALGKLQYSISSGIWHNAGSIAVFSKS